MENLSIIALLILITLLVLDSLRAHERATSLGKRICKQQGLQLLDQTVALKRMGIHWGNEGIRLRRTYQFDCSADGVERQSGILILVGNRLESTVLPPSPDEQQP